MRVAITLFRLLMLGALQIAPVWGKVLVRWTQPVVPPAAALGVNELVLEGNSGFDQLLQTARQQGYKVYIETAVENVAAVINASRDRKSTRLNSSHRCISYAVFCLKKKKKQ